VHSKLHINISQGVVDVEGDPDLVREVYADFKYNLLKGMVFSPPPPQREKAGRGAEGASKPKGASAPRKRAKTEDAGGGISPDSPRLDKHLDTSGLPAFYGQFEAKNNPEKILVFLKFLIDELGIEAPNTDQVYTCYDAANERVPRAFAQAFYDTSGKKNGYIDYRSPTEISVTMKGDNHFKFDLKRKAAE